MSRITRVNVCKVENSACVCGGRGPGIRITINKSTGYYSWSFCNDCTGMVLFASLGHGTATAELYESKPGDHNERKVS